MNDQNDTLNVGDLVLWSGVWANQPQEPARVLRIEATEFEGEKEGQPVEYVAWKDIERTVLVLDNGCWCYGYQVSRFYGPEPTGYKPHCPEPIRGRRKRSFWRRLVPFL